MKVNQKQILSVLILFVLIFSQFAIPQSAQAACSGVVYVDADSVAGSPDGCSWANAFSTLQDALAIASSGDQVWVAEGTYYPDEGGGNTNDDRSASFVITSGISLYGGFTGSESLLSQRNSDPATNGTVLSGEIGPGLYIDNSLHVIKIISITAATVVDGFTVTRGVANSAGDDSKGGGFFIQNVDSYLTLKNLLITDNRATNDNGGGLFLKTILGSPVSTPLISDTTFDGNLAERGGGLFTENSHPIINNVIFTGNEATAGAGGGANIQTVGEFDPPAAADFKDVIFSNNHATGGGGLFFGNSTGTIENATFDTNEVDRRGGGLLLEVSTLTVTNVTFYGNISVDNLADPKGGGGIMILNSTITLNNATFSGNDSQVTGGDAIRSTTNSVLTINNSILWGDTDDEILDDGSGTVTVSDSVVEGGYTGTNILTTDPLLSALADNGGFTQTMAIGSGGSAFDAGNNGTCASEDQRGVSRPQGAACDMGAFELEVVASYIDTTVAHFTSGTVGSCIVDGGVGDGALRLDLPATSCVFESRVFDAGQGVKWNAITPVETKPAGTSISYEVRTGNSEGAWTAWKAVSGNAIDNPGGQYVQYRATLSGDGVSTPLLEQVELGYVGRGINVIQSPTGTLTNWDHAFSWTGVSDATWYLVEVYTPGWTQVFRKWYTSAQAGCSGGTACSVTPTELSLANGDYRWRVLDYGSYVYGIWPVFENFTLNAACYTLTTNASPGGGGVVNVPSQTCTGGYTAGSVLQLTAAANADYTFGSWSGDAGGASNPVTVTMNGNKTVTANFIASLNPLSPSGTLTSWDHTFSWTGLSNATWYLIEAQTSGGTQVFRKWYTSAQAGCSGGTSCSVTPAALSLSNGDYRWRVQDYGAYGYGTFTAYENFTLNLTVACYTLTTSVSPSGSGSVTVPAQNCTGGYTTGSIVQLVAVPNTGYAFSSWSGDAGGATNPVSIVMDGNKSVTANLRGNTPLSPSGTLGSWSNTFSWTGQSDATWYLLEVQTPGGALVFRKWYTSAETGCSGGTACSIVPVETAGLGNGDYKWHILDYGSYGYGTWSAYLNFSFP